MDASKPVRVGRDFLDSMLTVVNRDLLICKLFYFFFFAAFGSLYPLLAIYFKQLGMNATQSGILIGFRPFIEFCSAPFWGGIADKTRRWKQLQLFSLFCWIVFTLAMAFVNPPPVTCEGQNSTNIDHEKLISPYYSTVYYEKEAVKDAFFALLLIIVIGEFFSAPAITFADTVTLSYLGLDTDNYGRQRMFGSLGWGLAMFFVGMALDNSTTFPNHPCEEQHIKEKNYIVCFAVFSVLMSCAFITATQFRFPGQSDSDKQMPSIMIAMKEKVTETITGKKRIDKEQLVDEDDEFLYGQPKSGYQSDNAEKKTATFSENGKPLQISLENKKDMVSDVVDSPGAMTIGPPDPDEPFLGRWTAVLKILAQIKFMSVLFVIWFMGFGIGLIFTFLFWYLQDLGGSPTLFGIASVINHISELLAYFLCSGFIAKFGHINILYAGLVGNIVRFMYISWLRNPYWVLPFEFVQGLTHAAVWATTCSYVMTAIPLGLRSSAQGILQGLHHGLGRGCGAVFGGILVYNIGSENTFRAYGISCILVLAAFFGINHYLKRKGVPIDSHIPHETLEEDPQMTFDPHGVPSGLVRDLSSSKLNKQEEAVATYGSTLGAPNARSTLNSSYNESPAPPSQEPDDDFNPRASEEYKTFSANDDNVTNQNSRQSRNATGERDSRDMRDPREPREPREPRQDRSQEDSRRSSQRQNQGQGYDQTDTRKDRGDFGRRDDSVEGDRGERRETHRRRASDTESPRRSSLDQSDGRSERKERRRRQSGDIEGLRERDDYYGHKESRERRHHGDRDRDRDRERDRDRDRDRDAKKRHKKRGSDAGQFQDFDPNPKEQVVFEQLPDLSSRAQQYKSRPRDSTEDEGNARDNQQYRQY